MNALIENTKNMTMTSREIAELTGKEHAHVMRDIRVMLNELHGEEGLSSFGESYLNSQNKAQPCFNLPKRETLILVSGYSVAMRARIIDRWQELESIKPIALPSYADALRQLADTIEISQIQQQVIEKQTPKVEAYDRIATADGSLCLTDAAKELQVRPKDLVVWLSANQWIYKRAGGGSWIGYQSHIQCGNLEHKSSIVIDAEGRDRIRDQVRITAKGLSKLADVMGKVAA